VSTREALLHLIHLFKETGQAHHQAFASTNGANENWPQWYAEYLRGPLNILFGVMLDKEQLMTMLVAFDQKHKMDTSHTAWAESYARLFLEHYGLLKPKR
jgi:hypothetical protein